jgi:hypothetical protein
MTTLSELDTFTRAYIECALWSSTGGKYGECPCCGQMAVLDRLPEPEYEQEPMCAADGCGTREMNSEPPLDENYSESDLAPETLQSMSADCDRFQRENADAIGAESAKAGHDFWLTRNGHGAGFWDGGWPESGDALTDASKEFGEFNLYPGDDGKIYGS